MKSAAGKRRTIEEFFNEATHDNLAELCADVYHPDVEFRDPVHQIKGRDELVRYYRRMYENVISISFEVHQEFVQNDEIMARWTMKLRHKRLKGGDEFQMDGVSHVRYKDAKIIFHRDYFDLGEMLYERIPVVGAVIRGIKSMAADR